MTKASINSYAPYNIGKTSEEGLRIPLAVAEFSENDLSVRVEESQLVIHGKKSSEDQRFYLHRGIAARQFQRTFALAAGIEVVAAETDNGLLHIDLQGPRPDARIRTIKIRKTLKRGGPVSNL